MNHTFYTTIQTTLSPIMLFTWLCFLTACEKYTTTSNPQKLTSSHDFFQANEPNIDKRESILEDLSQVEALGKHLFFDTNLSEPAGQSCASCHSPKAGFADPDKNIPVSEGVVPGNFGGRNALSASYMKFAPDFDLGLTPADTKGGFFWDGRKLNLEEQAKAPFLNPLEMNNPSLETVVADVMSSMYADLFKTVYGVDIFNDFSLAYDKIAEAIAAYERSIELNAFNSKYDFFKAGLLNLSPDEALGLELFTGKAMCHHCHHVHSVEEPASRKDLFSDFKYVNIGLAKNMAFPLNLSPAENIDLGLGGITLDANHNGKFKTPHLRNISKTGPYMHNGIFKTLEEVVHFYNTRDIPGLWPAPEVSENVVVGIMIGNLGLTEDEEEAIVEFMETLTDGFSMTAKLDANVQDDDD